MPWLRDLPRRELGQIGAAMVLGLSIRVVYVLATPHLALAGDMSEYDLEGRLFAAGHPWWTTTPYGILHASAWKAPAYPAWVGFWYWLAGHDITTLRLAQTALGPVTIALTAALGRRLFGARVGVLAAIVVAIYPLAWQFEELLYPEALATPLMLGVLLCMLAGAPTRRRALLAGGLTGASLLVRPTSFFVLAGIAMAWWIGVGLRPGSGLALLSAAVALAVVAPWTARNAVVEHGLLPISIQDAAAYGTFNADAASDPVYPYAWRPLSPSTRDLYDPGHPRSDMSFRSALNRRAVDYVRAHPASVPAAFFWNGLSRLWDIRRLSRALEEVPFEGRSSFLTKLGIAMYWLLLPLAVFTLWASRRRRALVWPVLASALAASLVFTVASGTRYRAPLEPLVVVLACATLARATQALPHRRRPGP